MANCQKHGVYYPDYPGCPDCRKDRIAELEAEVERRKKAHTDLQVQLGQAMDRAWDAEEENTRLRHDLSRQMEIAQAETERAERLREAAKPFANARAYADYGNAPSEDRHWYLWVTAAELGALRAALSEKEPEDADKG